MALVKSPFSLMQSSIKNPLVTHISSQTSDPINFILPQSPTFGGLIRQFNSSLLNKNYL